MAPQQNSTLIEDDFSNCDMLATPKIQHKLEEEEELLKRCSPILPPLHLTQTVQGCNDDHVSEQQLQQIKHTGRLSSCQEAEKYSQQQLCNVNRKCEIGSNANYAGRTQSHRSRSISLQSSNNTAKQCHKEITVWIGNEPRYVSGVTNKTTCNDIIKALIDDEIRNGNYAYCKIIGDGNDTSNYNGVGATSRDYDDYVIAECWRGIERSYNGHMTILPVWKAWSRVHNELRLTLRHRQDIKIPTPIKSPPKYRNLLQKYAKKFSRLWKKQKKEDLPAKTKLKATIEKEKFLLSKNDAIPDELLFVVLPDKLYNKDKPNKVNLNLFKMTPSKVHKQRLHQLAERHSSSKSNKHQRQRIHDTRKSNNCIRRRNNAGLSFTMRNSARFRLAQKTSQMDELYKREYELRRELNEKCRLHRLHNQIYSNPDQQWNISITQVQRKIENYAKEIISTEHELFELKNEIRQDVSLIKNLKRLTLERSGNAPPTAGLSKQPTLKKHLAPIREILPPSTAKTPNQMQFVDNIYEFCDNNGSMLV